MSIGFSQRMACLKEMGIQAYFPRHPLPGAALSPQYEATPEDAVPDMEGPETVSRPETSRHDLEGLVAPASIPQVRTEQGLEQASVTAEKPRRVVPEPGPQAVETTVSRPAKADASENIRFKLSLVRVGRDMAILHHLPWAGTGSLQAVHQRLLQNLLRALRLPDATLDFSEPAFHWPFADVPHLDQGVVAAREALWAWLETRLGDVSVVLLMGADLEPLLGVGSGFPGWGLREGRQSPKVLRSRALHEVLAVPTLKRELWVDLAPLRRRTG